jgi:catechol 2,3-dioxygenase-like lactoylglutathione lyase family enzyme
MTRSDSRTDLQTGHVGINVTDLDRAVRFYERVFGFTVGGRSDEDARRFAFLKNGDTLALTLWQQSEGRFDATRPGLHHLSFSVPTLADVRAAEARVREVGGRFLYEGAVPHGEGASSGGIFFEDPDGTRLEIFTSDGLQHGHAPTAGAPSCGFF